MAENRRDEIEKNERGGIHGLLGKGLVAIAAVIVLDVVAGIVAPQPGFPDIASSINANIEQVPPKTVFDFDPSHPIPNAPFVVTFHPSISTTLLSMWIVMAIIVAIAWLLARNPKMIPGRGQNVIEFGIEYAQNFVAEIGGPAARRYGVLFATLFIFILLSNWTDLFLFGEKADVVRTPTSDINVTFGLALVSFCIFQIEGMRSMGVRRYLGKFFNLNGFKEGVFVGFINIYIGLLEFILDFFKPVTLAVRLFGNIYGGGIMLGIMTSLLIAVIPIAFLALEGLIGLVQALIFSLLTLMYVLMARETHEEEAHEAPAFADEPEGNLAAPIEQDRAA